jgi:hypothetical protein
MTRDAYEALSTMTKRPHRTCFCKYFVPFQGLCEGVKLSHLALRGRSIWIVLPN